MDTKGLALVGILLVLVPFTVLASAATVDHNSSVQHNQPTEATVVETSIDHRTNDGDSEYTPVVTYEYTVDGETYRSSNVYPGQFDRWHGSQATAADVVEDYPAGSTATVHYNPEDPSEAYLHNPGWPSGWYVGLGLAVAVFAGGLYLIWQGFRRWRQRQVIANTPTEQARSLSIGPSEISGVARPVADSLTAPFSDANCVLAQYEVEEYDTSGDNSSWETRAEGVVSVPFEVDDGTGRVLVRPHEETTYDLDPGDWEERYVDSGERGPPAVQQFVEGSDDLGFPADAGGTANDRKYRQNLVRVGEEAYVFGTVQPRDSEDVPAGADNADRLHIAKITDDSMREPLFLISDDSETNLVDRRRWALWRLPVGGLFLVVAFTVLLTTFAPLLGIEVPRWFDGWVGSVS